MTGKGPYANETCADPGYQKDGQKRYPLTKNGQKNEGRIRAALAYISQTKNQKPYTPAQVASIKSRIMAAGKAIGIKYEVDK